MLFSKGSLSTCELNFNGENLKIPTCTTVKNLGCCFESRLRVEEHIKTNLSRMSLPSKKYR